MLNCCGTWACVVLVMELSACNVCACFGVGYITAIEANNTNCMPAVGETCQNFNGLRNS
jgi:hypothetical protein